MTEGGPSADQLGSEVSIEVFPATSERWDDLEALFGVHGAYAGCWCMWWRLKRSDFKLLPVEGKKAVLQSLVMENRVPGMLAYVDGQVAGWCSLGPRQEYAALEASRILKRVDDQQVWSVVCFFIARPYRRHKLMEALLRGGIEYAGGQGAKIVEGYPFAMQTPKLAGQKLSGSSGYIGIASPF